MRLQFVTLLIILACLQVAAKSDAQRISLTVNDQPLEKTFNQIQEQSGYSFWYQKSQLKNAALVTLKLKDATLKEALDQLFKDQPFSYQVIDKTIVVKERSNDISENRNQAPPNVTVRGTVLNEQGQPMSGVVVTVKGTNAGTTTDNKGNYSLQAEAGKMLLFSYVGYQNLEVAINNREKIDISLELTQAELDQVQVIGYGTTTRRLSTGNVSTVKAEDIARQPVSNPILALQGRVPGITIEQNSGLAGSNVKVRIQGQNSIDNGVDPFYVIDGVPYSSSNLASLSNILGGGSPLAFIDPSSIESIEVLKDADATSIYGSRAANGAILITTKKGKAGQTKVDFNIQQGWGKVTRKVKLLNTQQYIELRKEAYFTNDKLTTASSQYATQYDINGTWGESRDIDWRKELIGGTAGYQNYRSTISGGNSNTQFLFGTTYHRETTVFPGDLSDKKIAVQFSLTNRSNNNKFRFQLTGNYIDDNNLLPSSDLTSQAVVLAPNAPTLYHEDGSINWGELPNGNSTWANPISYLLRSYSNKTSNLITNSVIGYQILPGLELKSSFGYNKIQSNELVKVPLVFYRPESRATSSRSAENSVKSINSWIIEPQLTYITKVADSPLDFLLGGSFQNSKSNILSVQTSGFTSDKQLDNIQSAPIVTIGNAMASEYRYQAIFGRINYNLRNRYIVNVSARRDGTSRFGSENLFHAFYSMAGAWIFTEEAFTKSIAPVLTFGKLKVSYGTTGSDQIANYAFLDLYGNTAANVPYQGAVGLNPTKLANPFLQWEQTNKMNIGLDLGFMKNRLVLSSNYYRNTSSNQLLSSPLSIVTGFSSIFENLPATVLNTGLELSLQFQSVIQHSFKWTSALNITIPKNKLLEFPNLDLNTSYKNSLVIGQPLSIIKAYQFAGVNPETGLYQFEVNTGAGLTSSPNSLTDRTVLVNRFAKLYGGLQNTLTFKGFQLDFLFQFVKQSAFDYKLGDNPGTMKNQPQTVLNRWKDKGDRATIQKVSTSTSASFSAAQVSDEAYTNGSYIRLKNISLTYQFPKPLTRKLGMQNLNFFVLGQNMLTITKFQADPETQVITALPPLKMITIGVQSSF